jgi:hypothetical protein
MMSEQGRDRFSRAVWASAIVRLLAVLVLVGGLVAAVVLLRDKNLSPHNQDASAAATAISAVVTASFLAIVGYVIPVLLAIYDEAANMRSYLWQEINRQRAVATPSASTQGPLPGWGYGPPPQ